VQTSKAAPSLARFNDRLWVAFVVNNSTDSVLLCSNADGQHWTDHTKVGETSKTAPSLAAIVCDERHPEPIMEGRQPSAEEQISNWLFWWWLMFIGSPRGSRLGVIGRNFLAALLYINGKHDH
jgi:hypothetical protein